MLSKLQQILYTILVSKKAVLFNHNGWHDNVICGLIKNAKSRFKFKF